MMAKAVEKGVDKPACGADGIGRYRELVRELSKSFQTPNDKASWDALGYLAWRDMPVGLRIRMDDERIPAVLSEIRMERFENNAGASVRQTSEPVL